MAVKRENEKVYGPGHQWFRTVAGKLGELEETYGHTATPPQLKGDHAAALVDIREAIIEKRRLTETQRARFYRILDVLEGRKR